MGENTTISLKYTGYVTQLSKNYDTQFCNLQPGQRDKGDRYYEDNCASALDCSHLAFGNRVHDPAGRIHCEHCPPDDPIGPPFFRGGSRVGPEHLPPLLWGIPAL